MKFMDSTDWILKDLETQISIRDNYLKVVDELKDCSQYCLHLKTVKNTNYYTVSRKGETKRVHLGKADHPDVLRIQQYKYAEEMVQRAAQNVKAMDQFLRTYRPISDEDIRSALPNAYRDVQSIPAPIFSKDVRKWKADLEALKVKYPPRHLLVPGNAHRAGDGTLCRSKTECIILDTYTVLGIPYVYEAPFVMHNGIFHPDLTILHVKNWENYWHEHLGLFFSEEYKDEYRRKAMWKLDQYAAQKIMPGERLILTFEAPGGIFNGATFKRKVQSLFS